MRDVAEGTAGCIGRLLGNRPRSRCSSSNSRSERSSRSRSAFLFLICHHRISTLVEAGHITHATASIICFHCDSSTRSCFLPFFGEPVAAGLETRPDNYATNHVIFCYYSARSACMGSSREARQAGARQARTATTNSVAITPERTTGSRGFVPKSID